MVSQRNVTMAAYGKSVVGINLVVLASADALISSACRECLIVLTAKCQHKKVKQSVNHTSIVIISSLLDSVTNVLAYFFNPRLLCDIDNTLLLVENYTTTE